MFLMWVYTSGELFRSLLSFLTLMLDFRLVIVLALDELSVKPWSWTMIRLLASSLGDMSWLALIKAWLNRCRLGRFKLGLVRGEVMPVEVVLPRDS